MHFEALEQTLRLRLVSGPADKKFFFKLLGVRLPLQYVDMNREYGKCTKFSTHFSGNFRMINPIRSARILLVTAVNLYCMPAPIRSEQPIWPTCDHGS